MKKFLKKFFIVVISLIVLVAIIFVLDIRLENTNNIRLYNPKVNDSYVSFIYSEWPPNTVGRSLLKYKYEVNDDGILTVRFYSTHFLFIAIDTHITINNVSNVKRIDIQGKKGAVRTVWENGVNYDEPDIR